ncbi:MAG: acyl-protein synthetase [Bryobacterales bacterium]|nr:acyl-protein synthetase [Bryobacterales bacterium]
MLNTAANVLEQALSLPPLDRAALADSLIESLDTSTGEDAGLFWREEIRNRISELDAGGVQTVAWADASARLRNRIE